MNRPRRIAQLTAATLVALIAAPVALPGTAAAATPTIAQQAYAKASNTRASSAFGMSVAVSGNTLVVGAPQESSNATGVDGNQADTSAANAGAAYVFVRNGTAWTQQAYLKASNTDAGDSFGTSVAIDGNTIVVGALNEDGAATGVDGDTTDNTAANAGAAYVFTRSGTTWSQQAYLKASNTDVGDAFGLSVAISGNLVIVGAPSESSPSKGVNGDQRGNTAMDSGAAYVFARTGTSWSQAAYLKPSNTQASLEFGDAVAISGTTIVVGAPWDPSNATGVNGNQDDTSASGAGAAYVYAWTGAAWTQQAYLKASNTAAFARFGQSVAVSGNTVAVGSWAINGWTGAAYVFARSGTSWSQQGLLTAASPDTNDTFGWSVAVAGDTVVVGAPGEASSATGINGSQTSNASPGAGAAYSFVRSGATWSQQAYLKASNTGGGDAFGTSVAISGDTLVAGGFGERSAATGVNGEQTDNSLVNAGAAYAFFRSPLATKTTISSASSISLGATLKVTGSVSPAGPGTVTVTRYRLVSGKWKLVGSAKVAVKAGKYSYAVKPNARGSWRLVAAYSGGAGGGATYLASKSANKVVTVK
jgi:hypothetical protein